MAWSNKSTRTKIVAEKSHTLSFAVRVEDRLHTNIIGDDDELWFTVRPDDYLVAVDDDDIIVGTDTTPGTGVRVSGVMLGTGEDRTFQVTVQAAALNLDPDEDFNYDITYVRDGFTLSLAAGVFTVANNVTNRGAGESYSGTAPTFRLVGTVDGKNILNVVSSMPMPAAGDPGTGSYVITRALSETVGANVTHELSLITAPGGRAVQVGDVVFSTVTSGVLATVQSISTAIPATATLTTRQVYGRHPLKALLDTTFRAVAIGGGVNIETIDHAWTINKSSVPLPTGYEYRVGDMVFSHSGISGAALTKKMLISLVEAVGTTTLDIRTKVVFPMFLDDSEIADLLDDMVPDTRTVNSFALSGDVVLTEDHIPTGTVNKKYTATEQAKVAALPSAAALTSSLAAKSNIGHTHTIAEVDTLAAELAARIQSSTVSNIWVGTPAQYALVSPVATTLYFIKE